MKILIALFFIASSVLLHAKVSPDKASLRKEQIKKSAGLKKISIQSKKHESKLIAKTDDPLTISLLARFEKKYRSKKDLTNLKKETLAMGGKAVPALIRVMKYDKFPDKNRWVATFLLGRIIGKRSAPFISKFAAHPNWIMRLASLKTLLSLKQDGGNYGEMYAALLNDKSMLVRVQALENIKKMKLVKYAPNVWAMLYDKKNYSVTKNKRKRASIIKRVIKTIGDLKFTKAKGSLLKMSQKQKYDDIFSEIDYSLQKLTGLKSPKSDIVKKRTYWSKSVDLKTTKAKASKKQI